MWQRCHLRKVLRCSFVGSERTTINSSKACMCVYCASCVFVIRFVLFCGSTCLFNKDLWVGWAVLEELTVLCRSTYVFFKCSFVRLCWRGGNVRFYFVVLYCICLRICCTMYYVSIKTCLVFIFEVCLAVTVLCTTLNCRAGMK